MVNQNDGPATYDVTDFTIRRMTECGKVMRAMGEGATNMEEVAGRIVRRLYDTLIDGRTGMRACSLVRFFKTHDYGKLDDELKDFALGMLEGKSAPPGMRCLTLLGTVGDNLEWHSRRNSKGHRAIPLPSEETVFQIPMIRSLLMQLGLSVSMLIKPDPALLMDMEQKTFNVFLVPEALGSPYIPAQEEFVIPHGVKSVLGLGGVLPTGNIFVLIMFFRVSISREAADLFKALALSIKLAVLPFEKRVFA